MTIHTDVVIVGAGPVGLFEGFGLGLLGLREHVVEALDRPGGQCTELYPYKPIYYIPGLPVIGAQQLVDNLLQQAKPFDSVFHLGERTLMRQWPGVDESNQFAVLHGESNAIEK